MRYTDRTYEEVVQFDIDEAIKIKGEDRREFKTAQEWLHSDDDNPAKIPNNPLLTDYNWVYDHVEEIYCQSKLYYQRNQPAEAYYTFFKAITDKYPIDEDYDEYMDVEGRSGLHFKWGKFALNLVEFLCYSFDKRLAQLLEKEDVIQYFLKYPKLYTPEILTSTDERMAEKFLEYNNIASFYVEDSRYRLISLIKKHPKITIPLRIMLDENLIKQISRTSEIEHFYHDLYYIREQVTDQPFLDEHAKYCDEQVDNIKEGILPCYENEYNEASDMIDIRCLRRSSDDLQRQVMHRIIVNSGLDALPKKYLYQELSKYMVIGMFISRNYQTDPYNLLIDIETLYDFAVENNRPLQGMDIYRFLTSYESMPLDEIVEFYKKGKNLPLMEMLYDDWTSQKYEFVTELNSNIYSPSGKKSLVKDGIEYFDITDIEEPILVHNTGISIDKHDGLEQMIRYIKLGYHESICLSLQNQEHNSFYEKNPGKKTLKLAYGPLEHERVGIVYHSDAYSQGANKVEFENFEYIRTLYTLKSLMDKTTKYNEINYVINKEPFLPIGVICEDEITDEEVMVASQLNVPILYRKVKPHIEKESIVPYPKKIYHTTIDKRLF